MNRKLDFVTVVMALVFVVAVCLQIFRSFHWGHDNYGMTEWLINYAGGFVRRGLPGTMIYWLTLRTGIQANYIAIFLSVVSFTRVLSFFLLRSKRFV
ncbi:MAG: hypothetical protein PHV97_07615, partial [Candidatus Omnitrophica bacterium]|nr:hypothetical protein [Candidatus Omnitrophota bacterium]